MHVDGVARDGNDWLLADAVGSVRATVDQAGVVSAETAFTAFGEPLTGNADSFGFAGEQLDTTGLLHLRARQYNPTVGRFTTVDPVQPGAPGTTGYNLYTYAANNPTTFTDPTGQAVLAETSTINRTVSQPGALLNEYGPDRTRPIVLIDFDNALFVSAFFDQALEDEVGAGWTGSYSDPMQHAPAELQAIWPPFPE